MYHVIRCDAIHFTWYYDSDCGVKGTVISSLLRAAESTTMMRSYTEEWSQRKGARFAEVCHIGIPTTKGVYADGDEEMR
jgi:hypothetical protein